MTVTMRLVTKLFPQRMLWRAGKKALDFALLVMSLCICSTDHVLAVPLYHLTNLGILQEDDLYSVAYDVNNNGQVVGFSMSSAQVPEAFLFQNGTMQGLGTLGGAESRAYAINDTGQIVGQSVKALADGGFVRGFLYSNGVMSDVGTISGYINSDALAISNSGQIVGYSSSGPGNTRAMLYSNGIRIDLGTLGGANSAATGISDNGIIVGLSNNAMGDPTNRAFSYNLPGTTPFTMNEIIPVDNLTPSRAFAVNALGQIVGDIGSEAFLYEDSTTTGLGTLPGEVLSIAYGINELGQVVGYSYPGGSNPNHGFMRYKGTMYNLSDVLDSSGDGWTIQAARGTNDYGLIAGEAIAPNGKLYAVLLTPYSEADFDADMDVDGDDLAVWQSHYGSTTNMQTDADWDSDTDGRDFLVWQRQFGTMGLLTSGITAVPETSTLWLAALALGGFVRQQRRAD